MKKKVVFNVVKTAFFLYYLAKGVEQMINFSDVIKEDEILSKYDFKIVYAILMRLLSLGYIMGK